MDLVREHREARKALEERLSRAIADHEMQLERLKDYTSSEGTTLFWIGFFSAAVFAGALATCLGMV